MKYNRYLTRPRRSRYSRLLSTLNSPWTTIRRVCLDFLLV